MNPSLIIIKDGTATLWKKRAWRRALPTIVTYFCFSDWNCMNSLHKGSRSPARFRCTVVKVVSYRMGEIKVKNKINKNVMNIREGEGRVAGKKERREEKVRLFLLRPANSRGLHLSWRPDATRMTQDWMTSFSFYNHPSHFPLPSFCLSSSVISSLYLISFLSFLFFSDSFRTHRRARVMDDF